MKKVKPGDPLIIPAETFNTFIDVAHAHQRQQHNIGRQPSLSRQDTGIVLVLNQSGANRDRFDVLGITGVIIKPIDNDSEFQQRVMVQGGVPTADHARRFAVLLEPVLDGGIGRACIDGVCAARVRMLDEAHTYADVEVDVAMELQSANSGGAQLLWVEPVEDRTDPYVAWAVARVGGGSAVARVEAEITGFGAGYKTFLCKLVVDGSFVGDEFEVYARSYDFDDPGLIGQMDLTNCFPNYVVGDPIMIEIATFRWGVTTKTGWWCVDSFQPYECETS